MTLGCPIDPCDARAKATAKDHSLQQMKTVVFKANIDAIVAIRAAQLVAEVGNVLSAADVPTTQIPTTFVEMLYAVRI